MPHHRRDRDAQNKVTPERLESAREEAARQIQQRDEHDVRTTKLRDLDLLAKILDDRTHPAWWAIAFAVIPLHPDLEDVGLWQAVQILIERLNAPMQEAITTARGLTVAPKVWAGTSALPDETLKQATERILLGRGESTYAVARALDGHSPNTQSTALPEAATRGVRRRAAALNASAKANQAKLAASTISPPQPTGHLLPDAIATGLFEWFEERRAAAEAEQAAIVKNLARPQRQRRPTKARR